MTQPLSPAAQAVWTAFLDHSVMDETPADLPALSAALRALAARGEAVEIRTGEGMAEFDDVIRTSDILFIADELEGAQ